MIPIHHLVRLVTLLAGPALLAAPLPAIADAGQAHGRAIGEPAEASSATRTVRITLGDNYYEPLSVAVKAGETVRFVLTNKGGFLHDFSIGTAAMHAKHRQEMAMMVEHGMLTATGINHETMKMDHAKMGTQPMSHDDPNSALIEPGQTQELVWKFTQPADLQFACSMPGHSAAGMVGDIKFRR